MDEKAANALFFDTFTNLAKEGKIKRGDVSKCKRSICSELGLEKIPKNGEILAHMISKGAEIGSSLLRSKPVRTVSGVSVVGIMTKPFACPHGICLFCPGGPRFGTPQSYTGKEPAARRAKMNGYDPYKQIQARLKHYLFLGFLPEKIEVIVIGGTFTTLPKVYRDDFMTGIYNALNDFPEETSTRDGLFTAKKKNETARVRCVALAVETKPERCRDSDVRQLLEYGVTRVEIGVQSVFDEILRKNNRGHTINDVKESSKRLRDSAYKVDYHAMLNLPFSDPDKDRQTIREIYENESFKPDAIKIYPTLVIESAPLYGLWKAGKYKPYPAEDVINIIKEAETTAPKWLRIMRIERDIPSNLIVDGIKSPNLRQLVDEQMAAAGKKPTDIRGREIGHVKLKFDISPVMNREDYRAANGDEIFLSIDDTANKALIGFLRLRIPDGATHGLVRELHIYGSQKPLSIKEAGGFQHSGFGKRLLTEAERIAFSEYSLKEIKVISGVGVREYYRKQGYHLDEPYMVKEK